MKKYLFLVFLIFSISLFLVNITFSATPINKPKKLPPGIIIEYSIETENGQIIQKAKTTKINPVGTSTLPKEVRDAGLRLSTGSTISVTVLDDTSHMGTGLSLLQVVPYLTPTIPRKYLESSYIDTTERQYIGGYDRAGTFIPAKNIRVGSIVSMWGVYELQYLTHGQRTFVDAKITKIDKNNVTVSVSKNTESPFYGKPLTVGLSVDFSDFQKWTIMELTDTEVKVKIDVLDSKIKSYDDVRVGYTMKGAGVISTITAIDWDSGTYSDRWYFPENPPKNLIYKIKRIQ